MTETVPLLVLGCHRSGTSAITGLLHEAASVFLGDTLPPGDDNPKGYYESLAIVEAHKYLLSAMGRDWTCPPAHFEPDDDSVALIREALAPLRDQPEPWAVKDPRLLFMLPPWTDVLPAIRFAGVIRDPGAIAKSIASRNYMTPEGANRIVSAYIKRLADLHRAMPFPIIAFDDDYERMLARVEDLATHMGLEWDEDAARKFFAPSMVHHRASLSPDEHYQYLLEAAQQPVDEPIVHLSEDIAKALVDVRTLDMDELPRTFGPRFTERRLTLWRRVLEDEDRVDSVVELLPTESSHVPLGITKRFDHQTKVEVPTSGGSITRLLSSVIPPSHALAAGILDVFSQDQVVALISDLELRTRTHAVLHLDGPSGSRELLESAVEGTAWVLDNVEAAADDREMVTLRKATDVFRRTGETADHERVLLSLDARITALERDNAIERRTQTSHKAQEEIERLTSRNQDLERRLKSLAESHERLANRRSVRAALRLAQLLKPLFQWRRRI